jgi:hypothetical protein
MPAQASINIGNTPQSEFENSAIFKEISEVNMPSFLEEGNTLLSLSITCFMAALSSITVFYQIGNWGEISTSLAVFGISGILSALMIWSYKANTRISAIQKIIERDFEHKTLLSHSTYISEHYKGGLNWEIINTAYLNKNMKTINGKPIISIINAFNEIIEKKNNRSKA